VDPRQDIGTYAVVLGNPLKINRQFNNPDGTGTNLVTAFGSTWSAMARQSYSSALAQSFAVDSTNAATGLLVLTLTAAQTTAMATAGDVTTWHFDIQASGGTITPRTPFKGTVEVRRTYTHG
jgi:hypothetical protein